MSYKKGTCSRTDRTAPLLLLLLLGLQNAVEDGEGLDVVAAWEQHVALRVDHIPATAPAPASPPPPRLRGRCCVAPVRVVVAGHGAREEARGVAFEGFEPARHVDEALGTWAVGRDEGLDYLVVQALAHGRQQ